MIGVIGFTILYIGLGIGMIVSFGGTPPNGSLKEWLKFILKVLFWVPIFVLIFLTLVIEPIYKTIKDKYKSR